MMLPEFETSTGVAASLPSLHFPSLTRLAIPDRRPATCSIQNDSVRGLARHNFLFIAQMIGCQASSHLASETRIISGPPSGRAGTPQGPAQPLIYTLCTLPVIRKLWGATTPDPSLSPCAKGGGLARGWCVAVPETFVKITRPQSCAQLHPLGGICRRS